MANVIYYVPHQDDEIVSFGVSIIHQIMLGNHVHLVFYTDGSASSTIHHFNGNKVCPWHRINHDHAFDEQRFVAARNREMAWSSRCLGVDPANMHWRQHIKDGQFTVEQGISLIAEFEAKYPDAHHMSFTYKDPHPDHANMGTALETMYKQEKVSFARFYIKTLQLDALDGVEEPCKEQYLPFLHAAQQAYKIYNPDAGMFAVGYHSVKETFDKQFIRPRSKYHLIDCEVK